MLALGSDYVTDVCKILDINPKQTTGIEVEFTPDGIVSATVKMVLTEKQTEEINVIITGLNGRESE